VAFAPGGRTGLLAFGGLQSHTRAAKQEPARKGPSAMDQKTFEKGLEVRTAVLGEDYVQNSMRTADEFNKPFQELVTEYCWGAVWGREQLPRKTRSMLNIAMLSILNRPHELRIHLQGALRNGVTKDEIREILMQVAIYGGVPAAVDSFRVAREVLGSDKPKG
jgi:4-carboxymuconolactone decarboxylase